MDGFKNIEINNFRGIDYLRIDFFIYTLLKHTPRNQNKLIKGFYRNLKYLH